MVVGNGQWAMGKGGAVSGSSGDGGVGGVGGGEEVGDGRGRVLNDRRHLRDEAKRGGAVGGWRGGGWVSE